MTAGLKHGYGGRVSVRHGCRVALKCFIGALSAAGLSCCIAVQPINVPVDADAVAVSISGYGRPEDGFHLEINDPAKVRTVVWRLNAMSGRWRYRQSEALDANSADIAFYRNRKRIYELSAF